MDRILVADIGGTNCRFALFSHDPELKLLETVWHKTEGMLGIDDVLDAYGRSGLGLKASEAGAFVLAVAGPVADPKHARTTNAPLRLDLDDLEKTHGIKISCIINDFQAQAYACLTQPGTYGLPLLPCGSDPSRAFAGHPIGVVGAGTGLGTASLICDSAGTWLAIAAEGGHTVFPFVGEEEAQFEAFARRELGLEYARGDDILTGRGLQLLHAFLTDERLEPHEIAHSSLGRETETLRWFARFYGRTCRNWALTTLCRGGLFLAGGIAAKNPLLVTCDSFVEEFYRTPTHGDLLRDITVRLMTDENSGLWGAAWVGQRLILEEKIRQLENP